MFTTLGPFLNKIDRKTEQSDTHQSILRHNPDQHRRKGGGEKDESEFERDDETMVSINSLRMLLQSALPADPSQTNNAPAQSTPAQTPNNPQNRAAQAYQSTASHDKSHQTQSPPPQTPTAQTGDNALSKQDIKTIHLLLNELAALQQAGVENLPIQQGPNLLESMVKSIRQYKEQLGA